MLDRLHVLDHPLIKSKLTRMRDARTDNQTFRRLLAELTALMVYEITRDYPLREVEVKTPLDRTVGEILDASVVLVPILRAGTGMLASVLDLIPTASSSIRCSQPGGARSLRPTSSSARVGG